MKKYKVKYNYIETPDAEERLFRALSMLINEEDLIEYQQKKSLKKKNLFIVDSPSTRL